MLSRLFITVLVVALAVLAALILMWASKAGTLSQGPRGLFGLSYNARMMRLFRDLSRFKARRRRFGSDVALMPLLMGREKPLDIDALAKASLQRQRGPAASSASSVASPLGADEAWIRCEGCEITMTAEELGQMTGLGGAPMYLSVNDLIFDVSDGEMYLPGSNYYPLVGRNATLAFANACFDIRPPGTEGEGQPEGQDGKGHGEGDAEGDRAQGGDGQGQGQEQGVVVDCFSNTEGLIDEDYEDVFRWVEFYMTHDKYRFVGRLVADPVDAAIQTEQEQWARADMFGEGVRETEKGAQERWERTLN